ncbi:type I-E CRISPR-associated protein Cas7/Cse4/CasC [Streptomyces sp. NPDC001941]|uniref:type I-E CRISPR-associated protein Cas7/Cse4/CasC n=1 Tax=Streptomyces sp. NPDC001941 TaxID=3154659 RepID=UPI0033282E2A
MSIHIDLHVLHSYPYSNLNADAFGSPKMAIQGGVERTRISSQCVKRGCREAVEAVLGYRALRTRHVPTEVARNLTERGWEPEAAAEAAASLMIAAGIKGLSMAESGDMTSVMLFVPDHAINELADLAAASPDVLRAAREAADTDASDAPRGKGTKPKKKPVPKELKRPVAEFKAAVRTILASRNASIAAFGRMLTDAPDVTVSGAIAVAHSATTHAAEEQKDYFTAVDSIHSASGAAHLGSNAHSAGTFYRYTMINVDELCDNLNADTDTLQAILRAYLEEFANHVPGAKRNSTAPFSPPSLIYATIRTDQPVNLQGAFEAPIVADDTSGWITPSIAALDEHAHAIHDYLGADDLITAVHSGTSPALDRATHLGTRIKGYKDLVDVIVTEALNHHAKDCQA